MEIHWFILMQLVLHSNHPTNTIQAGCIYLKKKQIPSISSSPRLVNTSPFVGHEINWNDFSKLIMPSTELTQSQSDEITKFWRKGNEHMKYRWETRTLYCPEIITEMNEILLSPKDSWDSRLVKLCRETHSDEPFKNVSKKKAFFAGLCQFLLSKDTPFKVLQVIQFELFEMRKIISDSIEFYDSDWWYWLKKTIALNKSRCIESIERLASGRIVNDHDHFRNIINFSAFQKGLGEYGISLVGDWSPADQKALFQFWITGISKNSFAHKGTWFPTNQRYLKIWHQWIKSRSSSSGQAVSELLSVKDKYQTNMLISSQSLKELRIQELYRGI
ncbi:uncharacterized protein MELLADRAFT_101933 [Melampsora larici-populina 98AG31]|uniref:Uncharacterized protein n=1 Tax=Melampsora larici-populina (strain 98AG31 / pathotype 3-4-7) TaxID=747676 RepID=F4R5E5_MELLP|nr:uncharacterized protein MELLADRAFT_101933 [Melampsora larici-populina 98AG31]EGG12272.1 hypothetical protein MELLADRAFT_101933 [Melampsora larici-populina 98AG31]